MHGFERIEEKSIRFPEGTLTTYEHKKTLARVLFYDTADEERAFTLQLRTLPNSDNGVAHILEHGVFSGSMNYKVKDPFVNLMKGSLTSFLNAMTFPDRTVYPFATTNETEFFNLMDVYLDSIYFPLLHKDPLVLAQEGYHIELDEEGAYYNGVVYNEMKGMNASTDHKLLVSVQRELYDNVYGYQSGGDPKAIRNLTQEEYVGFHKKYYHPSNTVVALYGKLDIERALEKLDRIFSTFPRRERVQDASPSTPLDEPKYLEEKSFSYDELGTLGMGFSLSSFKNVKENMALRIALDVLVNADNGPIKRALFEQGLATDVSAFFEESYINPLAFITVRGVEENKGKIVEETILSELERVVREGFDPLLLTAMMNRFRFALKDFLDEGPYPKGITLTIDLLQNYDRGVDPKEKLEFDAILDEIKLEDFAPIVENELLKNKSRVSVLLVPEGSMPEEEELHVEGLEKEILSTMEALEKRQLTEDDPKELEKLPSLTLKDLDPGIEKNPYLKLPGNFPFYLLEYKEEGIGALCIDVTLDSKALRRINLYTTLLGYLDTKNRDRNTLTSEILLHTGNFTIHPTVYEKDGEVKPTLHIYLKFLEENRKEALELLFDVLTNTIFEDEETIYQALSMLLNSMEANLIENGSQMISGRVQSYFDEKGAIAEELFGISAYLSLKAILENFDEEIEALKKDLEELSSHLFFRDRVTCVYSGEHERELQLLLGEWIAMHPTSPEGEEKSVFSEENKKEAFLIPSEVNYVAKGYNMKKLGYEYHGSIEVLRKLLETDYLWEKVRVLGGAYGASLMTDRNGTVLAASYRDPESEETLKVYDGIEDYLENLSESTSIESYIISCIGDYSHPLTLNDRMELVLKSVFEGYTDELRAQYRREMFECTVEKLKSYAPIMGEVMRKGCFGAIGGEELKKASETFTVSML
ncbi:insulinase family protein [Guggenheimella bovis]